MPTPVSEAARNVADHASSVAKLEIELALLAGLLGVLALGAIKKGSPPVPEQAIREAKLTSAAIKS